MPTLSELTSDTATIKFDFGAFPVSLVYHPAMIAEEFIEEFLLFQKMGEDSGEDQVMGTLKSFNKTLCEVIESWDITEGDGKTMIPLTVTNMRRIPLKLRMTIAVQIINDMRPNTEAPKILN